MTTLTKHVIDNIISALRFAADANNCSQQNSDMYTKAEIAKEVAQNNRWLRIAKKLAGA